MKENENYVLKNVRFHKTNDKDLLEAVQGFSNQRQFSNEVKTILRSHFKLRQANKEDEILDIVKQIKSSIGNSNTVTTFVRGSKVESFPSVERDSQPAADLMGDKNDGDEELF